MKVRVAQITILSLVVLVWELISELGLVSPIIMGPLSKTIVNLLEDIYSGLILKHLRITLLEFGISYAIAISCGLFIGFFVGLIKSLQDVYEPIISSLYAVPIIIIYPIILVILGFGISSKIVFASVIGFFPIVLNTIAGVNSVDKRFVTAARTMGAENRIILLKVILPAAFPIILTGLRLGMNSTMIGVIAGEMIASMEGMGYLIGQATTTLHIPGLYSFVLVILIVIITLNQASARLERLVQF